VITATPRPLYLREGDPVPGVQEAAWALGPVWTGTECLAPTGIRTPDRSAYSESLCSPPVCIGRVKLTVILAGISAGIILYRLPIRGILVDRVNKWK